MLLCRPFLRPLDQLFISTTLTLPEGHYLSRVGALVHGSVRGNDLAAAARARAPAGRALVDVDYLQEIVLVFHVKLVDV